MNAQRIDLIPTEIHDRRARRQRMHCWAAAIGVVVIALLVATVIHRHQAQQVKACLTQASELHGITRVVKANNDALLTHIRNCEEQIRRLDVLAGKHRWSGVLTWLSSRCPESVVLTHFQVDAGGSPSGARRSGPRRPRDVSSFEDLPMPHNLVLSGYAADHPGLLEFVSLLKDSDAFDSVSLLQTKRERLGGGEAVVFTVLCQW